MKKILSLVVLLAGMAFNGSAQKIKYAEVPVAVQNSFNSKHPGVAANWEKEKADYEANFMMNGTEMSVVYNSAGELIETEIDINKSELPAAIQEFINNKYSGKKIEEASKITKSSGMILYEVGIQNKDLVFSAAGIFITEVND